MRTHLRTSGALDNMTFDEYIAANSDPVKTTVDQDNYTMIANATGFPEANISIIAYDEPIFQYSSGGRTLSDYLQIILAVIDSSPAWLCGIPQHQKGETGRDGGGTFRGKPAGIHKENQEPLEGHRLQ